MTQRLYKLNSGRPEGLKIATIGDWDLYKTQNGFKVCASAPIEGKANFSFGGKENKIDRAAAMDAKKLRSDRPVLYQEIEQYFLEHNTCPKTESTDPYGDVAISQKQLLQPEQQWKRELLRMRRIELEYAAVKGQGMWEAGIRMAHAGIFKEKIGEGELQKALAYITKRTGPISLEALLEVERDYYDERYRPHSCETLDAQLNMLAGDGGEFEDLV